MSDLPQFVIPSLATGFMLTTMCIIVMVVYAAVKQRKLEAALLTNVLNHPESFDRIWFIQTAYNTVQQMTIYARDKAGAVATLASPRSAGQVWSALQQAGVVVHASP